MSADTLEGTISRSMRRQLLTALAATTILVGGLGGVAAYADISGAVMGAGTVIVEGRSKQIQHNEGGVVQKIGVREGDVVEAGQVLFQLDGTLVRANLEIVESQLHQLLAQEARLLAELGAAKQVIFPDEELASGDPQRIELLRSGQQELFQARRIGLEGRRAQLRQQIGQLGEKVSALRAQAAAVDENVALLGEHIADVTVLHKKGLMVDSDLIAVKREHASLRGSRAALQAEAIEASRAISEKDLALSQIDEEFREAVLTEIDDKRAEIAKLRQERVAALDRLERLVIRSPMTGYVHTLNVHTIGQVIAPGETLMQVIPADDNLVVEAKLLPNDIDQISKGQPARIRLTGLDRRRTPELYVHVLDVSPDLMTDQKTGATYYTARLDIPPDERARIGAQQLKPGMPVEVFVETHSRSVLSYLIKPMRDQIEHAMRED